MLISSVPGLLTELKKLELNRPHAHKRYWFRGQPARFELRPGVYRQEFGVFKNEEHRFDKEKHLNQDFKVLSAGLRTGRETDADLYFLQQHYRMSTRLLDWTGNPLAGLYFACGGDESRDGELFVIDVYDPKWCGTKIMTSRDPVFTEAIKALVEWKKVTCLPDSILAVRPDHFDRRITLQRSFFTFHVPKEPILLPSKVLTSFRVSGGTKKGIRDELSLLGIDHFSVYGDLEHLATYLTNAYPVMIPA
jgi:FRG domain